MTSGGPQEKGDLITHALPLNLPAGSKDDAQPPKPRLAPAKSDSNFIGVPPDMTESLNKQESPNAQGEFLEDEDEVDMEDEMEAQNNYLTQAELFKSYSEQNSLYCNVAPEAIWCEFGGRRIGRMSLEIPQLIAARRHQQLM